MMLACLLRIHTSDVIVADSTAVLTLLNEPRLYSLISISQRWIFLLWVGSINPEGNSFSGRALLSASLD